MPYMCDCGNNEIAVPLQRLTKNIMGYEESNRIV